MSDEKICVKIDRDLKDLIPDFLNNRIRDSNQISTSLLAKDFATILTLGHQMKGCGAGYGFEQISALGACIEAAAKMNNTVEIERLNQNLKDYLRLVEVSFE